MYPLGDTIVALSSPEGVGAIGLIRLSGPASISIVQQYCIAPKIREAKANTVVFSPFKVNDELIDELVVAFFKGPQSYTREDVVELSCHGSPFIIQSILSVLIQAGARPAQPGEFTYRAFIHGALDLSQAEAVGDLIASQSKAQHTIAMLQMRGKYSTLLRDLRAQLIDFAALLELELDFSEEDVEFAHREKLKLLVHDILTQVNALIESFKLGNVIKQGVPVAIIGKPNAGKSTLLNQLLQEDRAIVSEIAGTTRDTIEDILVIKGLTFRLIDTAGLRYTQDTIEAIGVEKALQKAKNATIVLYVFDPLVENINTVSTHIEEIAKGQGIELRQIIPILNKMDQVTDGGNAYAALPNLIQLSAKHGQGMAALEAAMLNLSGWDRHQLNQTVVSNARHLSALESTQQALYKVLDNIEAKIGTELLAFELRQAIMHLGSITGQISNDDLLDSIFTRFCIGK